MNATVRDEQAPASSALPQPKVGVTVVAGLARVQALLTHP